MKRILILLAILLGLGGLYFFVINGNQGKGKSPFGDREIAYKEFDNVDKIFIRERNKPGRFIKRKGERWYFKDSILISKVFMGNLERAITLPALKYIPLEKEAEMIKTNLGQVGIEVKLYDQENQILRDYWVGRNTNNEDGTAFLVNGADQPYVMEIPFSRGTFRGLFQFKENNIRDKNVAQYDPNEIAQIKINYPKSTDSSFILDKRSGGGYDISPLYPSGQVEKRKVNQKAIENFLVEFKELNSETYETGNPNEEKVKASVPFMICDITLDDGTTQSYKFWPFKDFIGNEINPELKKTLQLVERFFLDAGPNQFYLVQHRTYKNLMVTYNFFYI